MVMSLDWDWSANLSGGESLSELFGVVVVWSTVLPPLAEMRLLAMLGWVWSVCSRGRPCLGGQFVVLVATPASFASPSGILLFAVSFLLVLEAGPVVESSEQPCVDIMTGWLVGGR